VIGILAKGDAADRWQFETKNQIFDLPALSSRQNGRFDTTTIGTLYMVVQHAFGLGQNSTLVIVRI
jgi:hypothetical protein